MEFVQIEEEYVSLKNIELIHEHLIRLVNEKMTDKEKKFLLFFKNKEPDWYLLNLASVESLRAVKWKLMNLKNMETKKHDTTYETLQTALSVVSK